MSARETRTQLQRLKVADLRKRLSSLRLPTDGIKDTLIKRILEHAAQVEASKADDVATEDMSGSPLDQVPENAKQADVNEPEGITSDAPDASKSSTTADNDSQLVSIGDMPPPTENMQLDGPMVTLPVQQPLPGVITELGDNRDEVIMDTCGTGPLFSEHIKETAVVDLTKDSLGIANNRVVVKQETITKSADSPDIAHIPQQEQVATPRNLVVKEETTSQVAPALVQQKGNLSKSQVSQPMQHFSGLQTAAKLIAPAPKEVLPRLQGVVRQEKKHETLQISGTGNTVETKSKKKKKKKKRKHVQESKLVMIPKATSSSNVEIEYIQEDILHPTDSLYYHFNKVFDTFKITEAPKKERGSSSHSTKTSSEGSKKVTKGGDDSSSDEEERAEEDSSKLSKKKLRKKQRPSVAQLKQVVFRPDLVEMHDVAASDPLLLIHLKSTRNSVPVPRHWCFKRKYLQGKRGIEKPPFRLPDFIKATGVMEMRQALDEKEDQKSLKAKTRERVRPKMGKLTIDYQKLHDAFFKWQTKPDMTIHGDLYYEGKEFETRLKNKKPGELSDELRVALGMPTGLNKHLFPPPWLIAMQRYGPPPSYPNLRIAGLNAPIPEGCSFGYFVGGWGKPPVDESGRPLYGDVFGVTGEKAPREVDTNIDRSFWGELESEEEEEEEEEEDEEDEEEVEESSDAKKPDESGLMTPMEGIATPSGLTSIPAGLETPEMIELRKKKIEETMEQGGETPVLYTVLSEKAAGVGGAMMGSDHVYDISAKRKKKASSSDSAAKKFKF